MLSTEENDRLTAVGPDSPMGQMLRRYWIPACMAEEVARPGGAPLRLELLDETFVIFRDTEGKLGLLDEGCPHRGASLVLGRNEDCGLTCLYHGWRIATDGTILEMASEPEETNFRHRLKHASYPVIEAGGIVWAFLGPADSQPSFPRSAWMDVPSDNRAIAKMVEEANWVQALEGAIDSAHSSTLHRDYIKPITESDTGRPSADTRPKLDAETTSYGIRYAALRRPLTDPEKSYYARVTCWIAPWTFLLPPPLSKNGHTQLFVPNTGTRTTFYAVQWHPTRDVGDGWVESLGAVPGRDLDAEYRKKARRENNFLQDRRAMESGESFSGIRGISVQDMAMHESMGPVVDRTKEHLGASDVAIIRFRRVLLQSLGDFESGNVPVGLTEGGLEEAAEASAGEAIIEKGEPWQPISQGHVFAQPPV